MVKKSIQKFYSNKQYKLVEYSKFLYNVSLYKIWKDRAECIGDSYYAADSPLTIDKETISIKVKDYMLVKYITWLAAPLDYMLNNGFILYDESDRRKKSSSSKPGTIQRSKTSSTKRGRS